MINYLKRLKANNHLMLIFAVIFISISIIQDTNILAETSNPYLIKVNRALNCVTIYKKDTKGNYTVPVKAMVCSTGGSNTPLGTYKTPVKYRWKLLMGDVWGQYSTRIVNGILFHSVWYYEQDPSTLSNIQYNKLGTACSHGCIRLTCGDAKWIYDNCPIGTTVVIYDDYDSPGPLGKPTAQKLDTSNKTGWDPTDPSPDNPYNKQNKEEDKKEEDKKEEKKQRTKPTFSGLKSKSIKWGEKFNKLDGITAKDCDGKNISSSIKVNGDVDIYTSGDYKLIYTVKDSEGLETSSEIKITVKECTEKPNINGVSEINFVNGKTKVDKAFALKGVTADWARKPVNASEINVDINYNSKKMVYNIKYSLTKGNKTTNVKSTIYVDNEAPILNGVKDKYITDEQVKMYIKNTNIDNTFATKGLTVTDNYFKLSKSNIISTVTKLNDKKYKIKYKVKDNVGNTTTQKAYYNVINKIAFLNTDDITVSSSAFKETRKFALTGVKLYVDAKDVTKDYRPEIQIEYSDIIEDKCTIDYSFTIDENTATATRIVNVIPQLDIEGVSDKVITSEDIVDEMFVLDGITAWSDENDVTDRLSVNIIKDEVAYSYIVEYTIKDYLGNCLTKKAIFTIDDSILKDDQTDNSLDFNLIEDSTKEDNYIDDIIDNVSSGGINLIS